VGGGGGGWGVNRGAGGGGVGCCGGGVGSKKGSFQGGVIGERGTIRGGKKKSQRMEVAAESAPRIAIYTCRRVIERTEVFKRARRRYGLSSERGGYLEGYREGYNYGGGESGESCRDNWKSLL